MKVSSPHRHSTLQRVSLTAFAVGLAFAPLGCRAPGMKLTTTPSGQESRTQIDGVSVTLRPLNAATIRQQANGKPLTVDLAELIPGKLTPYKVGPQDVLIATVWDHPELSLPLGQYRSDNATGMVVDEDGKIYFPHAGHLTVAGMTVPQIRTALTRALDLVLRNPQVDVKVLTHRSQKVYVGGEVRNPATHSITDVPFTLAEAINRAGGFAPTADLSNIEISRGKKRWNVSFLELINNGNLINQIVLKDGDSIHVRSRDETPVYVLGEVRNPRSVPLQNGRLNLSQALADAGGMDNLSADARSVYVIRHGGGENEVDAFHLDATSPTSLVLADRFALKPRDLIFVDGGPLTRFNRVMNMILPTANTIITGINTGYQVKYLYRTRD